MKQAVQIVHWPGHDTAACDDHASQLMALGRAMGLTISSSRVGTGSNTICENCKSDAAQMEKEPEPPASAPQDGRPTRRQIVFNWIMGEDDLTQKDGYWGGLDEVAKVDKLLAALFPQPEGVHAGTELTELDVTEEDMADATLIMGHVVDSYCRQEATRIHAEIICRERQLLASQAQLEAAQTEVLLLRASIRDKKAYDRATPQAEKEEQKS